jgi:hypothetical protein
MKKTYLENLLHGSQNKFDEFNDNYLGTANGTGYIKAHWFIKDSDINNGEKGARLFAQNIAGIGNQYYIYTITLEVNENSIYSINDVLSRIITKNEFDNLLTRYPKYLNQNTTIHEFICISDSKSYEDLINLNILVLTDWSPDNGRAEEYISVLTTKTTCCKIIINNIQPNK